MFGLSRARAAVVVAVIASCSAPGAAYGLATTTTSTKTTSTRIGGPPIPTPGSTSSTTAPATGSTTTTTIPPPPPAMPAFNLPTDAGIQLLKTMQQANTDLKAAAHGLGPARRGVVVAQKKDRAARREQKRLEAVAHKTQLKLDATRTLLHQAAVEAYIHAGDEQLMNAISGYLSTTSAVDAGSRLHVLGTFGSNEKHVLDEYLALKTRVDQQVAHIRDVARRSANALRAATTHVNDLRATIDDARTRLAISLAGIQNFQTAATSATSPILGPSRLTAKQMADFVVSEHDRPHVTVSIEELAKLYLDEGAKTGVRGDVAFAQSILETGGFANPGSAPTDNNFAGIGWCDTCAHGFDFADADTGVRAQMQLLRIYVDPAFPDATYKDKILLPGTLTLGFRGKVQTWWDLWGTWATGALYGQRVYDIYERMVLFAQTDPTPLVAVKPPSAGKPGAGKPAAKP
jgi:Mannosyl-glycoprotein endo-beta-N-acetylglucosaminidase